MGKVVRISEVPLRESKLGAKIADKVLETS
jgi:hypothetical protein